MNMDPSILQQDQVIMASQSLGNILVCTKSQNQIQEKKEKPLEEALKCPRCDSNNTKFCYYNNYSLTQPRYFCKSCRRYWTKGGTLRNVPVGGGCRKNRRSSSSSSSSSSTSSRLRSMGIGGLEDHGSIINPIFDNNNTNPHLCYGSGNLGNVENWRGNIVNEQMGMQFDNLYYNPYNYNLNQEIMMMSNPNGENNRASLLGLPWQLSNGEVLGSSWHGLLNSALM